MIKVSFKENSVDGPIKKVQVFNNKVVTVTLNGHITIPGPVYDLITCQVWKWEESHPEVKWSGNQITVQGKAICSSTDIFDAKLGERIAESRAKIKLYRFMTTFTKKIMYSCKEILFGNRELDTWKSQENETPCVVLDYVRYTNLLEREKEHLNKLLSQ